jgi:hypothetical protein
MAAKDTPTLEDRLDKVRQIALLLRGIPRGDQRVMLKSVEVLLQLVDGEEPS